MRRTTTLALSALALCSACQVVDGLWGSREMRPRGADGGSCANDDGGSGSCGGSATSGAPSVSGGDANQGGKGGASSSAGTVGISGDAGAAASGGVTGSSGAAGEAGTAGNGPVPVPQSCDGLAQCNDESACTTLHVPGGELQMGRSDTGKDSYLGQADEQPEHPVIVSPFWLDKYEVTVGRFRSFVASYDTWLPTANAGNHPNVPASGWKTDWAVPANRAALEQVLIENDECDPSFRTWTPAAGNNECLPINCLDWYVSFAFCIWDGGRLPTEAEWEFAAAGGDQNLLFPWGNQKPDNTLAVFSCEASAAGGAACSPADLRPIGSRGSSSYGPYGHADLAGSLLERTRDSFDSAFYSGPTASQKDVVNLALDATIGDGVARGGDFESNGDTLRAAYRQSVDRHLHDETIGFRCARDR